MGGVEEGEGGAGQALPHIPPHHFPCPVPCSEVPTGSAVCVYQAERGTGDNNNGLFDIFRRRYISDGVQIDNPSGFNVSCAAKEGRWHMRGGVGQSYRFPGLPFPVIAVLRSWSVPRDRL